MHAYVAERPCCGLIIISQNNAIAGQLLECPRGEQTPQELTKEDASPKPVLWLAVIVHYSVVFRRVPELRPI